MTDAPADTLSSTRLAGTPAPPHPRTCLIIEPSTGWASLKLGQLWKYRDLLFQLAVRDIKLRYRQTALGVAWVILQPLLSAAIFSFVFGRVAKMPSDGVSYFILSYAGLLGWNVFNSTLVKSSSVIVGNSQLVSKVYFPRLILPLSVIFSTFIDFAVAACVLLGLMVHAHLPIHLGIMLLPLWILLLTLIALGLGFYCAAMMVQYRDLQYVVPVLLQALLYACPVGYGLSAVPLELRRIYLLNPLSSLLDAFRWSLIGHGELNYPSLAYSAVVSIGIFIAGAFSFKKMERRFADAI